MLTMVESRNTETTEKQRAIDGLQALIHGEVKKQFLS